MTDLYAIKHDQKLLLEVLGLARAGYHGPCRFCGSSAALSVFGGKSGWAYRCHSCGEAGDVFNAITKIEDCSFKDAVKRLTGNNGVTRHFTRSAQNSTPQTQQSASFESLIPIPDKQKLYTYAEACHIPVLEQHPIVVNYANERNVTLDCCLRMGVGFDVARRMWVLPIASLNLDAGIVALKLHRGGADGHGQKSGWFSCGTSPPENPRHGLSTLWPPPESFDTSEILYVTEGELKALRFLSEGLQAVSPTSGASFSWPSWEVERLRDFKIIIIFDDDDAGIKFKDKAVAALSEVSTELRVNTFK